VNGERCVRNLDFPALGQLADACLPDGSILAVCDRQGLTAWQSGDLSLPLDGTAWPPDFWRALASEEIATPFQSGARKDQYLAGIRWHDDEPVGVLLAEFPTNALPTTRAVRVVQAMAAGLGRELRMLSDLEDMGDDLTDRYEELNLVFALDADLRDASKAHIALYQLLRNCIEYRRAEFAMLVHPEIRFCQHYGQLPGSAPAVDAVVADCLAHALPRFQTDELAWIDNQTLAGQGHAVRGCQVLAVPVRSGVRGVVGLLAWIRDESSLAFTNSSRNLLEAMAQRAQMIIAGSFDSLTGLLNHSNFERSMQAYSSEASQHREKRCLLHFDIDYLQILNDTLGVESGDRLIRDAARLIRSAMGDQGWVAHFGGGKFYVLSKLSSLDEARETAKTLCAEFQKVSCSGFSPTLSVGITTFGPADNYDDALSVVKAACALAKKQGRNRVQVYARSERDFIEYRKDMEWFHHIHQALAEERLELFAQAIRPITRSESAQHFEVLLRMRGERGEVIPPGDFLPTAERYNLMTLIDRYVVDQCFTLLKRHRLSGRQWVVRLSVNLSAHSINDPEFQTFLLDKLQAHPALTEMFCFEVTESASLSDLKEGDDFLGRLQALGSHCALDDFGTGVSSFSYLKNLRVNSVKIDGSFIKPMMEDAICQAIVRSIREVAALKGIGTVAEFVENDEILRQLALIGIDYAQGYGVHKPEPLIPLLEKIAEHAGPEAPFAPDTLVAMDHTFAI